MDICEQFARFGKYNQTMNAQLYALAAQLPHQDLYGDRKAFFGSLFATLNHIAVADTLWLKRFATHPAQHGSLEPMHAIAAPTDGTVLLASDLPAMQSLRQHLDQIILDWSAELRQDQLAQLLTYANMKGIVSRRRYGDLIMHFFNHQTHHRGQVTTLLSQSGIDPGGTDLLMLVPDEA